MAKELKPCQFCGGEGKISPYVRDGIQWGYQVLCSNCGAQTYLCAREQPAIDDWNMGNYVSGLYRKQTT